MNLQAFLVTTIPKAAQDLETALLRLPEDKRNWSAGGEARTALDMVAEVAILNGTTSDTIQTRSGMADFDGAAYTRHKAELAEDWPALKKLLDENTSRMVAAVGALTDDDLDAQVEMPWGPMTLAQLASYPYWNACYHEGQINFIASMLGCLK